MMGVLLAKVVVGWLLGSLSGSLLLGRLRGLDIRQSGSGNAGGTNALRVAGWRFALLVVLIDVGKGVLAAALGLWSPSAIESSSIGPEIQAVACSLAAVLGHCWPVFFGFRGGKGAGTALGAMLVLAPMLAAVMVVVWLLVVATTRYVGLATVLAALSFPLSLVGAQWLGYAQSLPLHIFSIAIGALILFTHRSNLKRLWHQQEPRISVGRKS